MSHNETENSPGLEAVRAGIERVRQAFINQGNTSEGGSLAGCVGLIYSLVERGHLPLFEQVLLIHGLQFVGDPIAGKFADYNIVVCTDHQGNWFATSPSNFDTSDPAGVEVLQAQDRTKLMITVGEKFRGYWPYPYVGSSYVAPEIVEQSGQRALRVTIAVWDEEGMGFLIDTQPVSLFPNLGE